MRPALLAFSLVAGCAFASAAEFPEPYTQLGEVIVAHLSSAPFPHPSRADGHRYQQEFFSARDHYSDDTVALFIPKGFRETGSIDVVVHFHGWRNHVSEVFRQYDLAEQLVASGRNAVLVVPQGPRDAADSGGGKLEDPDGFKRFMADVSSTLRDRSALKRKDFQLGRIILSGHSGGYQVISSILDRGGLSESIREVWLFDALYAQTDKFLAWHDRQTGRLLDIYTEHGGTKQRTEELVQTLKSRNEPLLAVPEADLTEAALRTNRLVFVYTALPHNDVLNQHKTFELFLRTSCFEARSP